MSPSNHRQRRLQTRLGHEPPASALPGRVRVAMCQTRCVADDRAGNFARIEAALGKAAESGAQIACFPEMCILGWVNPNAHHNAHSISSGAPGDDCRRLRRLAREYQQMICVGLGEKDGDRLYNAAILIDAKGQLLLKHRKLRILAELMSPPYAAGEGIHVAATSYGRIGLLICADTFCEQTLASMKQLRPDLVLVPYGWAAEADCWPRHGELLGQVVRHAAQTIGAPVVGVDSVGALAYGPWTGRILGGQSVACDHAGQILATAADRREDMMIVNLPVGNFGCTDGPAQQRP